MRHEEVFFLILNLITYIRTRVFGTAESAAGFEAASGQHGDKEQCEPTKDNKPHCSNRNSLEKEVCFCRICIPSALATSAPHQWCSGWLSG